MEDIPQPPLPKSIISRLLVLFLFGFSTCTHIEFFLNTTLQLNTDRFILYIWWEGMEIFAIKREVATSYKYHYRECIQCIQMFLKQYTNMQNHQKILMIQFFFIVYLLYSWIIVRSEGTTNRSKHTFWQKCIKLQQIKLTNKQIFP